MKNKNKNNLLATRPLTFSSHFSSNSYLLNSLSVTGFVDAEGCFYFSITKKKTNKIGWAVRPTFNIALHKKDQALLESIQASLGGVGGIYRHGKDSVQLQVFSLAELTNVIIPYFDRYPLSTQKKVDYEG